MSLRIALLGLLAVRGPASGYDLAKSVERSVTHIWHARHSQIYPELVKMNGDGVIRVQDEGPRGRKIYAITEQGVAELRTWLFEHQPSMLLRSEWALKAFLLPVLDPAESLAVLDGLRTLNDEATASIEHMARELRPVFAARQRPLGEYALDLGIRYQHMLAEWIKDVDADIRRRAARPVAQAAATPPPEARPAEARPPEAPQP